MENSTSMLFNQVLIFDVESEYGHFRKFNTTTSPLTYSTPPRPTLAGLMGAILGIEREVSAGNFKKGSIPLADLFTKDNVAIAIQLLNPVKKVNIAFNLLDTEKTASSFFNVKQRTQIEFELLKHPKFRIYVSMRNKELFSNLIDNVKANQTHFTPYLGLSQFTATVKFIATKPIRQVLSSNFEEVLTAVNLANADINNPIKFDYTIDNGFKYTADTQPIQMRSDRVVTEYAEIIIETNGKPMLVNSTEIYQVEDFGNILFL